MWKLVHGSVLGQDFYFESIWPSDLIVCCIESPQSLWAFIFENQLLHTVHTEQNTVCGHRHLKGDYATAQQGASDWCD